MSACLLVRIVEDPAEGPEPSQIAEELLLGQRAGHVDRLDVDLVPAALFQDAVNPAPVREGELPRRVRLADGHVREERCRAQPWS